VRSLAKIEIHKLHHSGCIKTPGFWYGLKVFLPSHYDIRQLVTSFSASVLPQTFMRIVLPTATAHQQEFVYITI